MLDQVLPFPPKQDVRDDEVVRSGDRLNLAKHPWLSRPERTTMLQLEGVALASRYFSFSMLNRVPLAALSRRSFIVSDQPQTTW